MAPKPGNILVNLGSYSIPKLQASHRPSAPFQRISFSDAMLKYGSDKPDLRIPWVFEQCSDVFGDSSETYGFVVRGYGESGNQPSTKSLKKKFVKLFPDSMHKSLRFLIPNENGNSESEIEKQLIERFKLGAHDLLVIAGTTDSRNPERWDRIKFHLNISTPSRPCYPLLSTLGHARNYVADLLNLRSQKSFSFAWIVDFPLFVETESDSSKLESAHHPFTAAVPEDVEKLKNLEDLASIKGWGFCFS